VIEIPTEVPVMALANAVLFPHSLLPLHIFERRYAKEPSPRRGTSVVARSSARAVFTVTLKLQNEFFH
jgi:hypothetical protein